MEDFYSIAIGICLAVVVGLLAYGVGALATLFVEHRQHARYRCVQRDGVNRGVSAFHSGGQ